MSSIGNSGTISIWSMDALTFDVEGQAVILWLAFPHIAHRLFLQCQLTSSGLSLPLGPRNFSCGQGGCWLFCQLKLDDGCDVWDDMDWQNPKVCGMFGIGLYSFLCVNLCSSICSQ